MVPRAYQKKLAGYAPVLDENHCFIVFMQSSGKWSVPCLGVRTTNNNMS